MTEFSSTELKWKLGTQFNGRKRWFLHVRRSRKKFTFAISSSDEFLYSLLLDGQMAHNIYCASIIASRGKNCVIVYGELEYYDG